MPKSIRNALRRIISPMRHAVMTIVIAFVLLGYLFGGRLLERLILAFKAGGQQTCIPAAGTGRSPFQVWIDRQDKRAFANAERRLAELRRRRLLRRRIQSA